jgi:hypothetical protein
VTKHYEPGWDEDGRLLEVYLVDGPGPCGPVVTVSRHPFAPGTRVRHVNQEWAREATAVVVKAHGPFGDGSYEYEVFAGELFAEPVSESNPMTRPTQWSSLAVIVVEARL